MREHKAVFVAAVGRHQYGAGRPGGAETLVHAVQVVSASRPEHAWVQLDVANAFPSISRRAVLDALGEHAPALLPLAETFLLQAGKVRCAADFVGASGWEEDVEDLLRDAAAAAGVGGLEA